MLVIVFWFVTHISDRVSVMTGWCTTPSFFGTSTRSSHDGKPFETSFCQNPFLPIPDGCRSIVTGRPRTCGISSGAIASWYGELALGDALVGEEDFVGMRDHDLTGAGDHGCSRVTSRVLIRAAPMSRG